jgi:hypothetical protein
MRRCSVVGLTLTLAALGAPVCAVEATYLGAYVWVSDLPDFGGWSGFDLSGDGTVFRAVSDVGLTIAGRLERDSAGRVTGLMSDAPEVLLGDAGEPLAKHVRDAEGLAVAEDGSFFASFEGSGRTARIVRYADAQAAAEVLLDGTQIDAQSENKGLEGLALAADGLLYGIVEAASGLSGGHGVHVMRDGAWSQPLQIPRDGTWRVAGADFGPDGQLYVLERDFWPLIGFRSRVLRLRLDGDAIAATVVLFETTVGIHDNLEGIAVWTAPDGTTHLTMISDDNFRRQQRTEIVDYRIDP